jgi:hypothetical protein
MAETKTTRLTIKKGALRLLIKKIIRDVLNDLLSENRTSKSGTIPLSGIDQQDLRECYSKMGFNLTEQEMDLLYRMNSDVKAINPQFSVFPDKESIPGVCSYVIDAEPMLLYFRIQCSGGDCFKVEQIKMAESFRSIEARADKKFSDHIQSVSTEHDLTYKSLLDLLSNTIENKPLWERFQRMKAVLNG